MSLSPKTTSSMFVHTEDVEREVRRLARFGIEVKVGPLNCKHAGEETDARVVAFFYPKMDEQGWEIRLTPTATEEEQLDALHRAFEVISNPETHPWWQEFPEILQGAKSDWGIRITAPKYPTREDFARSLAKEIQEFVQMKVSQASPSMLGAWGYYEGGMRPHSERFNDYGAKARVLRHVTEERQDIIAGEVRAEMARQFKTAREAADLLNLTPATVRRSLKGTRPFRPHELIRLAEWFELDVDDLLGGRFGDAAP